MSNYYGYRDVSVMMAHKLMETDGWKVYGYHADESDLMTDYYSPAYWNGVAEKNGYILVVNCNCAEKPQEIREYHYDDLVLDKSIADKIAKLEQMITERGASPQEEETAQKAIEKLRLKQEKSSKSYVVTGTIPCHMANPPRMNWHIEKDGTYILKGNGLLKFSSIFKYYGYCDGMKEMDRFVSTPREQFKESLIEREMARWNSSRERAAQSADSTIRYLEEDKTLIDKFEAFMNRIDAACGRMIGKGDAVIYEKVKVTEFKKEFKAVEISDGKFEEGQCFTLKSNFTYGRNRGYVYRIHESETNGITTYYANKLNRKRTKECTGMANTCNYWYIGNDTTKFLHWLEKGALAWCEIREVNIPYEVEKVVRQKLKNQDLKTASCQ